MCVAANNIYCTCVITLGTHRACVDPTNVYCACIITLETHRACIALTYILHIYR